MPNTQVKDKLITLEELGAAYNSITPANIGAVAKTGDTMTGRLNINNGSTSGGGVEIWEDNEGGNISIYSPNGKEFQIDAVDNTSLRCYANADDSTYNAIRFNRQNCSLDIFSTRSSGGVELRCDGEGGNIVITGPNGGDNLFEIDAVSNTELRCFSIRNGSYKGFSFNGLTGKLSVPGGFEGPIATPKTVTGTPDSNGNISLELSAGSYVVVSAKTPDLIVIPWVNSQNSAWYARVTSISGAAYTGSVTVTVYYQVV